MLLDGSGNQSQIGGVKSEEGNSKWSEKDEKDRC